MSKRKGVTVTICPTPFDWKNYGKMKLPNSRPWTEQDWIVHERIFNRLAKSRKPPPEPKPAVSKKMPLKQLMPRINLLAQPKSRSPGKYIPPVSF